MLNWIDVNSGVTPPKGRPVLCYCPEWIETEYQVATWNGDEFYYTEQSNGSFSEHVEKWALFYGAD